MKRLSLIGMITLTYLFILSGPSLAQMYWTSAASEQETVVASAESTGQKVGKLAQSAKSVPEKDKGAVEKKAAEKKAPKAPSKKAGAKVPLVCP